MKKTLIFLALFLLIGTMAGCSREENTVIKEETDTETETETVEEPFDPVTYLQELPDDPYDREDILLNILNELKNEDLWEEFHGKIKAGQEAVITIARTTIEGDPIYTYLVSDEEGFTAITDTSHDHFGQAETYTVKRKYLYEFSFERKEETNGGLRPFVYRFAFLSDTVYETEEAIAEDFNTKEANDRDWVDLWMTWYVRD